MLDLLLPPEKEHPILLAEQDLPQKCLAVGKSFQKPLGQSSQLSLKVLSCPELSDLRCPYRSFWKKFVEVRPWASLGVPGSPEVALKSLDVVQNRSFRRPYKS